MGKQAKSVTSMEYEEIIGKLKAVMDSKEMTDLLGRNEKWLYSMDNDKVHKGSDLTKVGLEEEDRFARPELSSDMHKVVEHVHAWLQARMQLWLEEQDEEKITADDCKEELRRLFEEVLPKEQILKDVKSLKATYQAVIDRRGGYITLDNR
jgi:hypothetical protein